MRRLLPLALVAALSTLTLSTAMAETDGADQEEDEFSFLEEGERAAAERESNSVSGGDFDPFEMEDEDEYAAFGAAAPAPVVPQAQMRVALGDHFPVRVVETLPGAVVVELPVVTGTASEVSADYWLIGEVFVDGRKVGETRQLVMVSSLSEHSGMAYLKIQAPVQTRHGQVEVRVSQVVDGQQRKLFTRATSFGG